MSIIHCSPLFHPLEPLPIMSPQVMRSGTRRNSSKTSITSTSTTSSPSVKRSDGPSSKSTSKKSATPRRTSQPPTTLTFPMPTKQPPVHNPTSQEAMIEPLLHPSPYENNICTASTTCQKTSPPTTTLSEHSSSEAHSQAQSSLTLTVESQVSFDLSSSQPQNHYD